nr:hypothetical protein [Tanacetum cinerariifolium]
DRATVAKSSTLPHDTAPWVTSPAAVDIHTGSDAVPTASPIRLQEQIDAQVARELEEQQEREDKRMTEQFARDAEVARIHAEEELHGWVLTSMDAATVLAGGIDVPTGSGFIPTAGPPATVISAGSEVGPTASPIATRRKGKEVMVESDTPKKKKLQEQINAQVARELEKQQEKENMRMNE